MFNIINNGTYSRTHTYDRYVFWINIKFYDIKYIALSISQYNYYTFQNVKIWKSNHDVTIEYRQKKNRKFFPKENVSILLVLCIEHILSFVIYYKHIIIIAKMNDKVRCAQVQYIVNEIYSMHAVDVYQSWKLTNFLLRFVSQEKKHIKIFYYLFFCSFQKYS